MEFSYILRDVTDPVIKRSKRGRNTGEGGSKYVPNAGKTKPIFFAVFRPYFACIRSWFPPYFAPMKVVKKLIFYNRSFGIKKHLSDPSSYKYLKDFWYFASEGLANIRRTFCVRLGAAGGRPSGIRADFTARVVSVRQAFCKNGLLFR